MYIVLFYVGKAVVSRNLKFIIIIISVQTSKEYICGTTLQVCVGGGQAK